MMTRNVDSIRQLLIRDLSSLENEIRSYENESDLWRLSGDIKNTAGNLALHICGNLQHFVGATIGQDGYVRQRDLEFSSKNVPASDLINEIKATKSAVENALDKLSDDDLNNTYPLEVFGKPMTFSYFLIHLSGHLMYHLGQINYHRRLLAS